MTKTTNPALIAYRPDIDGLRAFAVMSVFLFHLDFKYFSGGFVGGDVFFVISGFLITNLIKKEVDDGTFTFANFYFRRIRRLFPALFFVVFLSFIFGFLLLSPTHFESFCESAIYAILATSNFLFWKDSGYFDIEASFKPLLHTWSLGVEEQFYLVWPAIMVALLWTRRKWIVVLFLSTAGELRLRKGFPPAGCPKGATPDPSRRYRRLSQLPTEAMSRRRLKRFHMRALSSLYSSIRLSLMG